MKKNFIANDFGRTQQDEDLYSKANAQTLWESFFDMVTLLVDSIYTPTDEHYNAPEKDVYYEEQKASYNLEEIETAHVNYEELSDEDIEAWFNEDMEQGLEILCFEEEEYRKRLRHPNRNLNKVA